MEVMHLKSISLSPKRARSGRMYLLVKQNKRVSFWFLQDWLKIKSTFQDGELARNQRIHLEKVGHVIIINISSPINTYSIMFTPKEYKDLQSLTQKIDAVFEKDKITFYTWETTSQTSSSFFLSLEDCYNNAANNNIDVDALSIIESKIDFPEKSTLIRFVFSWIIHKQLHLMMINHNSFLSCFDTIRNQAFSYWVLTFRLCLQLHKRIKLMHIEFSDCCLAFDSNMKKEIHDGILFNMCPIELLSLFQESYKKL